jgi:tetratricopeptide (TPR) repeat protein
MNRLFSIILFCLLAGFAAATPNRRFDEANRNFSAGEFGEAARIYQNILNTTGPSAAVLFNLGNCEQNLGKYGPAILAYERARLLAPRDPDLLANLARAREAAAVFEETGRFPRRDAFFAYLSLNEWSWLLSGSVLLLGVLAVLFGILRIQKRPLVLVLFATVGLAVCGIVIAATALYLRKDERNLGVVLTASAAVRLSPFEKAESIGTSGPGHIVHLLKASHGFYYVWIYGTELRGWMSDQDVSAINAFSTGEGG